MSNRVVITGLGAITPIGNNVEEYWQSLRQGRSGVARITHFDPTTMPCKIAAEVKNFDPSKYIDKKEQRRFAGFIKFGVCAAMEAVEHSGLDIRANAERVGIAVGSGIGGIEIIEEATRTIIEKGPTKVSPFTVPMMIANMGAGQIGIATGAKGPNLCAVTACASGTHSIGAAYHIIKRGDADAMVAGGAEAAITPISFAGFCAARALSTRNDDPEHASRPFDLTREGFVMGEGAGMLVMESLEHAQKRGATILAEMVGYGETGDAYHITSPAPGGEGGMRAMLLALKEAGITPDKIDYINAHGTSTELNDKYESMAIKAAFGDHARKVAISSSKSMTGHLLGAAGAIEAVACIKIIEHQIASPTINYVTPDPECDLDYVPNQARAMKIDYVMSNSFGFGGQNGVLVFKKW